MELDAFDGQFPVPQSHDHPVGRFGRYLQDVGYRGPVEDQGVVAGGFERVG